VTNELLFLVGGLATGLLAGLWGAHHLPARWRASTASEPRPEPPWTANFVALDLWKRGNRTEVVAGVLSVTTVQSRIPEAPPPVDVQALSPPRKATGS
jgi:hypothetical protein